MQEVIVKRYVTDSKEIEKMELEDKLRSERMQLLASQHLKLIESSTINDKEKRLSITQNFRKNLQAAMQGA